MSFQAGLSNSYGHNIEAIIAKKPINEARAIDYGLAVAYEDEYAIVIFYEESVYYWSRRLSLSDQSADDDFYQASETTFFLASELGIRDFVFIRTDYFGGLGEQHVLIVENGTIKSKGYVINDALKSLGVVARERLDEFDTLNLGAYRGMEEYYWEGKHNFSLARPNMLAGRVFKG